MKHHGSTLIGCREMHHVTSLAQSGVMPQAVNDLYKQKNKNCQWKKLIQWIIMSRITLNRSINFPSPNSPGIPIISNYHSIELAPFAPKTGVGIEDIQNETIDIVISQKRT